MCFFFLFRLIKLHRFYSCRTLKDADIPHGGKQFDNLDTIDPPTYYSKRFLSKVSMFLWISGLSQSEKIRPILQSGQFIAVRSAVVFFCFLIEMIYRCFLYINRITLYPLYLFPAAKYVWLSVYFN